MKFVEIKKIGLNIKANVIQSFSLFKIPQEKIG